MASRLAHRLMSSGGRLTTRDHVRLVLQGLGMRFGIGKPPSSLVRDCEGLVAAMHPPAGALARAAAKACAEASPPWLVGHCHRTWAWAAALGTATGISFDPALLHAAALLHDLGLTDAFRPPDGECFAVASARGAREVALAAGASERAAGVVAEAVVLHMEVRVAVRHGPEAHLLQAGAGADVLGARLASLPAEALRTVLREHPRGDMNAALADCLVALAARAPRTRLALYCRRFAFADRVRRARMPVPA